MMTHFESGDLGDLRRGCREPHGHRSARNTCPTTATARRATRARSAATYHRRWHGAQDQRSRRVRQCPPRPVRPGARRLHEAGRARPHPHQRVRRGNAEHREPYRTRWTRRTSSACRSAASSTASTRTRSRCGTPISTKGSRSPRRRAPRRCWSGRGNMPTIHLFGGTIMGTGAANSVVEQLRPDPRDRQPVDRRARHLPDRRRVEPDLHDLRGVAARRRASGGELGQRRQVTIVPPPRRTSLAPVIPKKRNPGRQPGVSVAGAIGLKISSRLRPARCALPDRIV